MNLSFQRQQEQQKDDARKRTMPWREYWHLYLSLTATGILTAFAGLYLGLAPSQTGEIVFLDTWDMVRRGFFALYYAGSFLLVAEGATLFAKDKLLKRDVEVVDDKLQDVALQRRAMTAMLWISVGAIVATTVAAGTMLASWLGALDRFVTIPAASQSWIVLGPPALLVFDTVMALLYQQSSKQAELDRWVEQQKRLAEAGAKEAWASEYVRQYNQVAPAAARRAANAAAMTDARKWAGSAVDMEQPQAVMDAPKEPEKPFVGVDMAAGPDRAGVMVRDGDGNWQVMDTPSVAETPDQGDGHHGNDIHEDMASEPLPESEAGTDQTPPF